MQTDYTKLDDTEFFRERRRLREELERVPEHHPDHATLAHQYAATTTEFERRAATAWEAR